MTMPGGAMTAPSSARQDWLRDLHARIVATKAALDGARAAYEHSPNSDTERVLGKVGRELNRLLDLLPRPRSGEQHDDGQAPAR